MKNVKILLAADAVINLLLGTLLIFFPSGILDLFGLPQTNTYFYSSILGGVIFGIGIALGLEHWGDPKGIRGLGLGGAIAINLFGGGVLLFWLLFSDLYLPPRGQLTLWVVAILVLGIGLVELFSKSWRNED
jgi:hypothetical protein